MTMLEAIIGVSWLPVSVLVIYFAYRWYCAIKRNHYPDIEDRET